MGRIEFTTAGESHGRGLVAVLEGVPAGLGLVAEDVDVDLRRRMMGYGRGARMKIESDRVEFLSGVRAGETLGSPVAMVIWNHDWENWSDVMDPAPEKDSVRDRRRKLERPRPGHADLVGWLKYARTDARDILERASARETAARVACGAVCRKLLGEFGMTLGSHVRRIGDVEAQPGTLPDEINDVADESPVRCLDGKAAQNMIDSIDRAKKDRDTLGGIVEIVARGVPVGLGSHVSWDRKLDGRIARAMMSIPAAKGVEIGDGMAAAGSRGSQVHDEIERSREGTIRRRSNRAGGVEGGITTGEAVVVRVAMKPISTLMRPLDTISLQTGEPAKAQAERSDVTAVPAMGVIGEAMLALTLADALLEKCGGDSIPELRRNFDAYLQSLDERLPDVD